MLKSTLNLSEIEDKIAVHSASQNQTIPSPREIDPQSTGDQSNRSDFERPSAPLSLGEDSNLDPQSAYHHDTIEPDTNDKSSRTYDYTMLGDSKQLENVWGQVLQSLRAENMALFSLLKATTLLPYQENNGPAPETVPNLKIACNSALTNESIIDEDDKTLVVKHLRGLIGHPVQIEFVATGGPSDTDSMETSKTVQKPTGIMFHAEVERDAQLAPTLDLFEAKILKIEPK